MTFFRRIFYGMNNQPVCRQVGHPFCYAYSWTIYRTSAFLFHGSIKNRLLHTTFFNPLFLLSSSHPNRSSRTSTLHAADENAIAPIHPNSVLSTKYFICCPYNFAVCK
jgi:hypothetical protein